MPVAPPFARPFFSIVMPTHLRPLLLQRALQSLLAQAFQSFEILLVADAWDPASAEVATRLLRPTDTFVKRSGAPGPALSRNMGLSLARGEWVVFLDDDDSFAPHHLARLHERARAGDAEWLYTDCEVVTEDRQQPGMPELTRQLLPLAAADPAQLWVKNFIPNHALAYRRSLLEGCLFDPHMASLEDWEFLLAVYGRAAPRYWSGGGVVMHKDYVNPGQRRGQQENASNSVVIQDFLYTYRRWPAPTPELKAQRQALLATVGLSLPPEWF